MKFASSMFRCFHPSKLYADEDEQQQEGETIRIPICNTDFRVFSYDELKASTQGFKNKIGEGGFGSVYKGQLRGDDDPIAVKVVSVEVETMRGEREFISEIAALSDMKHHNLVNLRGCCIHGSNRLLVYDYMENNSLNHTFLGNEHNRAKFTWMLRKHVSLGIARGLCYLHEEVNPHIVHRDIRASNILLDRDFTPKLADFGSARLFRDNISYISTRVAGTLGYLSPEYAYTVHLTRKSDVYSFGVLLLEIVSGRPVVDYHLQYGEQYLVEKAWELYNDKKLLELVDSELKGRVLVGRSCPVLENRPALRARDYQTPTCNVQSIMLNNEVDIEDVEISHPGLVADLMEVKIRRKQSSNFTSSAASSSTTSVQGR